MTMNATIDTKSYLKFCAVVIVAFDESFELFAFLYFNFFLNYALFYLGLSVGEQ